MAVLLKIKNKYGISKEDIDELISLMRCLSRPFSKIPKNFDEIEKLTRDLLVCHKEHLICNCEYFRFIGAEQVCRFCGGQRDKARKYYTIPIAPRLQQLKEVTGIAKKLKVQRVAASRYINDLHMSPAWLGFHEQLGEDAIALSYCSDGFNPFHHNITAGSYSIWAQSGLILNLPPHWRVRSAMTMLFGLIAGPRAPKRMNIYNQVIVDELKALDHGISTFDASTKTTTTTRARIMFMVCDVPGNAKEQNRVQQNAKAACGHCHLTGQYSSILDKTIYPAGQVFLPPTHPFRQDSSTDKKVVLRTKKDEVQLSRYYDFLERDQRDNGTNNKTKLSALTQKHGRYGSSEWFRLDYLDLQQKHAPVEPMHALKVVAEHVIKILNGDEDGPKLRAHERANDRFKECCPDAVYTTYVREKTTFGQKRRRTVASENDDTVDETGAVNIEKRFPKGKLPPAPFCLTAEEKQLADQRLSASRFPPDFGDIPDTIFTQICGGVKSHTWHQLFTSGILRFCIRDMLGKPQRDSLCNFLLVLEELFKTTTDVGTIDALEMKWHEALFRMERDFPASLQGYVMHLLHHLPQYIRLYGPPSQFWMFPYERFNKTLTNLVTNSRDPELNIVKKMEVQWLVSMLDGAGFFEPLQVEPTKKCATLEYLHQGRYKAKSRPMSDLEMKALLTLLDTPTLSTNTITVFHYAKKQTGKKEVLYRDVHVEKVEQRERAGIVACTLPGGQYVGQINFFFQHGSAPDSHELAFIDWIGKPEMYIDAACYMVQRTSQTPNPVMWVSQLSAPLIHAWEDEVLWLPFIEGEGEEI